MDTISSWSPLFSTIVTSTLWEESKEVRLLFVTMLALKNKDGEVLGTVSGLRRLSNLTLDEVRQALVVLEAPDKRAETDQQFEGRRVEKTARGWRILNHEKYRDLVSGVKRRAYQANWQRNYRERQKGGGSGVPLPGETSAVKAFEEGHIDEHEQPIPAPPGPEPDLEMPTKPTETEKRDAKFFKRVHLRGTKD